MHKSILIAVILGSLVIGFIPTMGLPKYDETVTSPVIEEPKKQTAKKQEKVEPAKEVPPPPKPKPAPKPKPKPVSYSGTKEQWMTAAGLPQSVWWAVDSIVSGESGWNPSAVNPSSGACGLGQQLPCGKWNSYGAWNDPIAALVAMNDYVHGRYGGWSQAVAFRNCTGQCYNPHTGWSGFKDHQWY